MDGLATLTRMREREFDAEVVIISGHGSVEAAVRAIKMGAFDFVEKPLSLDKTVLVVRNALRQRRLQAENIALRARVDAQHTMVGESHAMSRLRDQIAMAAPSNGRVLIFGENGTGKELVARNIHAMSRRRSAPFVEVNCAAIPEELIESELFGHVRGAFTGAVADRRGKFETANGGTIFLDEIADMSLKTQAKVLRVLQEQVMEAVGGSTRIRVDARVLAATNKDLTEEIRAGRFREDLYFRLNVVPIFVPPLRERPEDIQLLADHFMALLAREYGRRPKTFEAEAVAVLRRYGWPGNVRELRNVVERLMIMVPGEVVTAADLAVPRPGQAWSRPAPSAARSAGAAARRPRRLREGVHPPRARVQQGNMSRTADVLGVERSNLYRKMRRFGIAPDAPLRRRSGAVVTPSTLAEVPTPALIVDVAALDRNIARMARFFAEGTCRLRPHVKAHKTPEIARRQLAAGSCVGLTCATLREAEAVAGFCDDILLANEIVTADKCGRAAALAASCRLTVAVDSVEGLEALACGRARRGRDHRRAGGSQRGTDALRSAAGGAGGDDWPPAWRARPGSRCAA
jgi:two-component system nitrogen regulation response regulator NtrX